MVKITWYITYMWIILTQSTSQLMLISQELRLKQLGLHPLADCKSKRLLRMQD